MFSLKSWEEVETILYNFKMKINLKKNLNKTSELLETYIKKRMQEVPKGEDLVDPCFDPQTV